MKHLKSIITLIILTFTLASYSTDDAPDVDTNLIVGTWSIQDLNFSSDLTYAFAGQTISSTSNGSGSNFDYTVTFNEDNTLVANGSYDYIVTSTTDGEEFTQTITIEDVDTNGTWSIDGNQLTFTGFTTAQVDNDFISGGQDAGSSTIEILNATTLLIASDLEDAVPLDLPEGIDINIEESSDVTLTRIN
jgi:hypothetical protein